MLAHARATCSSCRNLIITTGGGNPPREREKIPSTICNLVFDFQGDHCEIWQLLFTVGVDRTYYILVATLSKLGVATESLEINNLFSVHCLPFSDKIALALGVHYLLHGKTNPYFSLRVPVRLCWYCSKLLANSQRSCKARIIQHR